VKRPSTACSVAASALLLSAILAIGGCRAGETSAPTKPPAAGEDPAAQAGAAQAAAPASAATTDAEAAGFNAQMIAPWTGDFDGMVKRRRLRALVVTSKTYYFVENGQPRGTAYESLKAFEDQVNKDLRNKNVRFHVVFIPTSRAELVPALLAGRGDVAAAALTVTEGRREKVDFTRPLWTGVKEIAVTGPASPALATLDDLSGKEVFARKSSSFWEHLEALNERFASEKKPPVKLVAAPEDLEDEDLLEMLNAGAFGIAVVDEPIATLWTKIFTDIRPHPEVTVHEGGEIAWMLRKDSPQLKAKLDSFVATHGQGSSFGNTIAKRYVGSTTFVKRSTSPEEIAKFQHLVKLFEKYGKQYDVDYLLAMAQGYQESRLDQGVKSSEGAIGIMQVLPTTAADLEVGDIKQVEPNVHAGVKYIRWMIDTYFKDEPMNRLNKGLFAFAAYNCGPGKLRKLRAEAKQRGLDSNVWFNNVEIVAADRIGAETPTYVSNIYKYYIAYKLVAERDAANAAAKAAVAKR
jgi:membrane-bound lytic murein transglycosylase MltF